MIQRRINSSWTGPIVSRRDMLRPVPISLTSVDQRHRRRRCELNHFHPVKLASFRHGGVPHARPQLRARPGTTARANCHLDLLPGSKVLTSERCEERYQDLEEGSSLYHPRRDKSIATTVFLKPSIRPCFRFPNLVLPNIHVHMRLLSVCGKPRQHGRSCAAAYPSVPL